MKDPLAVVVWAALVLPAGTRACAQTLSATAVTGTFQATAGSASSSAPVGTPVAMPPVQVSTQTAVGGTANALARSSVTTTGDHPVLATTLATSSQVAMGLSSPPAGALGEVLLTLAATQPVWVRLAVDWNVTGSLAVSPGFLNATAYVDVGDDGVVDAYFINLGMPAHLDLPAAFGPGTLRIRTWSRIQGVQGNMEQYSQSCGSSLLLTVGPDRGPFSVGSASPSCGPVTLEGHIDFARRISFRAGAMPGTADLGALVLGSAVTATPLPSVTQCLLRTDPFVLRLLSPAELAGAPVVCELVGLPRPFALHAQLVTLQVGQGLLHGSNLLTVGGN